MFGCGIKHLRIGQYENSSAKTSAAWVEQTRGVCQVSPDVDEAIRSLGESGMGIEIELQYSNPLYQGDPANWPKHVTPQDDEPPNPIFIPPRPMSNELSNRGDREWA